MLLKCAAYTHLPFLFVGNVTLNFINSTELQQHYYSCHNMNHSSNQCHRPEHCNIWKTFILSTGYMLNHKTKVISVSVQIIVTLCNFVKTHYTFQSLTVAFLTSIVGSYSSTKWFWMSWMVRALFPTPPAPTTTSLYSVMPGGESGESLCY